jgi:glycolate oxidase FAD binding subunit
VSRDARACEERVAAILGRDQVASGEAVEGWRVGGGAPAAVAFPRTVEEVKEVMTAAAAEGWAVVPSGRGLSLAGGEACERLDVVLSTSRMDGTVDYEPADLTLSVEAGASLEAVANLTAGEGQWLPMEPPGSSSATLGGAFAYAFGGPLGTSFGRPRDLILGLTCVTGDARILRLGGRVVKNVAGFDLLKLLVGSQGTLGVITEVTVRLYPIPATETFLVARSDEATDLVPAARAVATAPLLPASVELGGRPGRGAAALVVRLRGSPEAVAADAHALRAVAPGLTRVDDAEGRALVAELRGLEARWAVAARLALPASRLGEGVRLLASLGTADADADAGRGAGAPCFVADPNVGVFRLGMDAPGQAEEDRLAPLLVDLRREAEKLGGSLTLVQAPAGLMGRVGARGGLPAGVGRIHRGLKRSFDPSGTLAPGRLGR